MRLLLVEDDELLGDGLFVGLQQSGYTVEWIKDGLSAEVALKTSQFDIIVLDLGLPKIDGLTLLKRIRASGNGTPTIILTARDNIEDKILGLDSGADDYLVKPFDLDELSARLRALLRRQDDGAEPVIKYKNIMLDPAAHRVLQDEQNMNISGKEYALLHYLLKNQGRVIPRAQLEENLYGWDGEIESNSLEVFIHHLRKKLGADLIRTVRGVGYIIEK